MLIATSAAQIRADRPSPPHQVAATKDGGDLVLGCHAELRVGPDRAPPPRQADTCRDGQRQLNDDRGRVNQSDRREVGAQFGTEASTWLTVE
jgi:hypothetical protein